MSRLFTRGRRVNLLLLGVLPLFLDGCGGSERAAHQSGTETSAAVTASGTNAGTLSLADLASATYRGIYDHPVTLSDGLYEGEPFVEGSAARPQVGLVRELVASGDLDGDGAEETAVLLWESSGGSGTFLHVAAVAREAGVLKNVGTAPVGDRVQVRTMEIAGGEVVLEVVDQGPEDAACCPTHLARKSWRLESGELVASDSEDQGTLSLGLLDGSSWVLEAWQYREPAPAEPGITLAFEEDRITGFGGCNRYFAPVNGSAPGSIRIGPAGGTRMVCADSLMALEDRYLGLLEKVSKFSFQAGRLALGWQDGDVFGSLLFARMPQEE